MKNYFETFNWKGFFLLAVIISVMINNFDHMSEVYYQISANFHTGFELLKSKECAYFVAVSYDVAVIAFIINGQKFESITFAFGLFLVNLIFWHVNDDIQTLNFWNPKEYHQVSLLVAKVIFSAGFSFLIHRASSLYFEIRNGFSSVEQAKADMKQVKAESEELKAHVEHLIGRIKEKNDHVSQANDTNLSLAKKMKELEFYKSMVEQETVCQCGFAAPLEKGLDSAKKSINAHKGTCPKVNN